MPAHGTASYYSDGRPVLRTSVCIPHKFVPIPLLLAAAYKYAIAMPCSVCKHDLRKSLVRCQGVLRVHDARGRSASPRPNVCSPGDVRTRSGDRRVLTRRARRLRLLCPADVRHPRRAAQPVRCGGCIARRYGPSSASWRYCVQQQLTIVRFGRAGGGGASLFLCNRAGVLWCRPRRAVPPRRRGGPPSSAVVRPRD